MSEVAYFLGHSELEIIHAAQRRVRARVRARGAVRCDGSVLRKQRGFEHGFFQGPDAARCTLTSLVEAGPSWFRSIAPVVDDPELRDQGRCGSQQSSVALGMTLFVKRKEYNWQTCEDP